MKRGVMGSYHCKIQKKGTCSLWKLKQLSFVRRVCLINSVLTSLPLFFLYFPFFKIPLVVLKKIVSLQRNFLWGGEGESENLPWVMWENVCLPKECGGLGIKGLRVFNEALLGEWRWMLLHKK